MDPKPSAWAIHPKVQSATTPESNKGSPKVNFPSRQWISKVENVSGHGLVFVYPLEDSGVVGCKV